MLGINRMLTDKAYRNKVVANVTDVFSENLLDCKNLPHILNDLLLKQFLQFKIKSDNLLQIL